MHDRASRDRLRRQGSVVIYDSETASEVRHMVTASWLLNQSARQRSIRRRIDSADRLGEVHISDRMQRQISTDDRHLLGGRCVREFSDLTLRCRVNKVTRQVVAHSRLVINSNDELRVRLERSEPFEGYRLIEQVSAVRLRRGACPHR